MLYRFLQLIVPTLKSARNRAARDSCSIETDRRESITRFKLEHAEGIASRTILWLHKSCHSSWSVLIACTVSCLTLAISVCSTAHAQSGPANPVIFVHGLNSSGYTWARMIRALDPTGKYTGPRISGNGTCGYAAADANVLAPIMDWPDKSDGKQLYRYFSPASIPTTKRYFAVDFSSSNDLNLDQQAIQLSRVIDCVIAITGVSRVILVAHSMGGLAARKYLQSIHVSDVQELITIGTPHKTANSTAELGARTRAICRRLSTNDTGLVNAAGHDDKCANHAGVWLLVDKSSRGVTCPP